MSSRSGGKAARVRSANRSVALLSLPLYFSTDSLFLPLGLFPETETFEVLYLCICTGLHVLPQIPTIPGIQVRPNFQHLLALRTFSPAPF